MGSRENLPSPHSPRNSVLAAATESDRSYSNSPEAAGTPVPARASRSDASSPEPGNPDILRELLERKRSLMMLSLQAESQVIILSTSGTIPGFDKCINFFFRLAVMEDLATLQKPEASSLIQRFTGKNCRINHSGAPCRTERRKASRLSEDSLVRMRLDGRQSLQ